MRFRHRNITREFLFEEYINKKRSFVQIGKELDVPYETIYYYKKKFNIPTHPSNMWNKCKRNSILTEFKKGNVPWNKGKKGVQQVWNKGKKLDDNHKKKISLSTKRAMQIDGVKQKIERTQFKKGNVPWNKGKTGIYSKEVLEILRRNRLNRVYPKKNTKIEQILFHILDDLNKKFQRHKRIGTICQADAFVKPNFVLFADGDYWHSNPLFFEKRKRAKMTDAQIKNAKRDEEQNRKLIKEGYIVLRFWESDLINKFENCKEIVKKVII